MKVSPKITTIQKFSYHRVQHELLLQTKFKYIHKQVLSEFNSEEENKRKSNDDTRYHDEARTSHHSVLSSLPVDVSYSTDQPGGRVHDQVKLATMFSKVSPENKATSKAEYTNNQQGLLD
jgi:hypothetical protein